VTRSAPWKAGRLAALLVFLASWPDLRTHMKRYVKALQFLCLVLMVCRGCAVRLAGKVGVPV
jgi:hypothetical protein